MILNELEKRELSIKAWRLAQTYSIPFSLHMDLNTYVSVLPGTGLGKSEIDFSNNKATIYLNLPNHDTMDDLIETLYHEIRHLQQPSLLPYEAYSTFQNMLQPTPAEKELPKNEQEIPAAAFYHYNPLEIDARVFAKTRGDIPRLEVLNKLSLDSLRANPTEFLLKCQNVAQDYKVENAAFHNCIS